MNYKNLYIVLMLLLLSGCNRLGESNVVSSGSTCLASAGIEVNLTVSEISISESSSASVTLTSTASAAACEDITVTLSTSGTATNGTDYSALDGTTITIATNSTTGTKTFTATDDSVYEGNEETVIVDIASVSGSSATESGTQSVTVTLTENESAPTVSIASSTSSVFENGSNLTLTATSTQAADEAITVVIGTSGVAIEGTDYANVSDITIAAGSTTGTATFDPTPDAVNEGAESATIAISSTSGAGSSKSGATSIAITINEYALTTGTDFTEGSTADQNTIKNRSSWTTVDQSSNTVHPFELLNIHKVHSFSSGGTSLTGVGQTIYISDSALNANHDSFTGKTVTMLDNPSTSTTTFDHGTHVASIAAGIVGETTQGVAPGASLVFSDFADNATDRASDLDTARTVHSAVVANHSWGYCDVIVSGACRSSKTMTELESSAASAGRNIREQLEAAYWGGSAATSAYITALDNFQNSGVIVFSSGNISTDTGVGFMGALPYYFNGTSDSVDLSDAWLSVMYAEFTGSSLASASASDFNRLGNPCGKAKEWCLVVDDRQIGAAGYVNSSGTSVYSILGGSSMGAPMVSGGVALMAQAFPSHTPEQLVDRILASANNAWFTPEGNTTFTTHGNSIKHGYHSTWGQGVPDFYAALSPITSNANPFSMALYTGNSIQSSKAIDLNSSFITPSSSFGNAISQGMIGEIGYAYDALSGGFKYRMSSIVNVTDNKAPAISLSSELSKLDQQLEFGNNSLWKQNFSQVLSTLSKTDTLETNVTLGSSSIPVQSFFGSNSDSEVDLSDYQSPYLESGEGGIGLSANYQLGKSRLLLGATTPIQINTMTGAVAGSRKSLIASLEYGEPSETAFTLMTGITQDEDSLLGSTGNDAYSMSGSKSNTTFAAVKVQNKFTNDLTLTGVATAAKTDMSRPTESFINSANNVKSSSVTLIATQKNITGDDSFSFSISQPNRVNDGAMSIRLSNLAESNGSISYRDNDINLEPAGRQMIYGLSYRKDLDKSFGFSLKHLLTRNLNHNQSSKVARSSYIGAKYKDLKLGFNINSQDSSRNTELSYQRIF